MPNHPSQSAGPPLLSMRLNEYQDAALRTARMQNNRDALCNFALGLCGEAGECSEHVKKHLYHGKQLDVDALSMELGDVLWYVATLADAIGVTLDDVARRNVDKLKARHPEGFRQDAELA